MSKYTNGLVVCENRGQRALFLSFFTEVVTVTGIINEVLLLLTRAMKEQFVSSGIFSKDFSGTVITINRLI